VQRAASTACADDGSNLAHQAGRESPNDSERIERARLRASVRLGPLDQEERS
jgi:hypothetical protein